ncbi:MAG: hypothetical protein M1820_010341 [Bogoriella megaspora]|nr:MAG: hypothetical protein M1820_010341 [Bogoriella megaspora]
MAEGRGQYQELTEFSGDLGLYEHNVGSTPEQQTPNLAHQQSYHSGQEPLISPPASYQASPNPSNGPQLSPGNLGTPSGSAQPKNVAQFAMLRDSSFRENLSPEEYKGPGTAAPRTIFEEVPPGPGVQAYRKQIYFPRRHWLYITLIVLSVYATILSGIYLLLALVGPRYGRAIRTGGRMDASGASLLTQIIAKTIEMSFVTVFVAFLGQVLSRKAFKAKTGQPLGITLAEMNMRVWIMQPGLIFTRWESVRYAVVSLLGVVALLSAVVAMLYTSAADALVKPQLRFNDWEHRNLQGMVNTSFANAQYILANCKTPITLEMDPSYAENTCLDVVDFAAQSYNNFGRYIARWSTFANTTDGSTDPKARPLAVGQFNALTDVTSAWVELHDVAETSKAWGRTVDNVSLAMPHSGIVQAARDPVNSILQPEDLEGLGIYKLQAAVPSPVINTLCVQVTKDELSPLVYTEFPNVENPLNTSIWPTQLDKMAPGFKFNLTGTKVDNIFNWSSDYGQWPPIFPKFPVENNTVLNQTSQYGREYIYILTKGAVTQGLDYTICGLRAFLTPNCSTHYEVTANGGNLTAVCDDTGNSDLFTYRKNFPDEAAHMPHTNASTDFFELVQEWATTLSLGTGITDSKASIARLLAQLVLPQTKDDGTNVTLQPKLPSTAEALAALAESVALISAEDSPFVPFWNYTDLSISPGQYQNFPILLSAQQYASGPSSRYQKLFYPVLVAVFLTNIFVLVYFITHRGLVTDFSEPLNLFALAVNTPPKEVREMQEGKWIGPEGRHYETPWFVKAEGEKVFLESGHHSQKRKSRSFLY